MRVNGGSLSRDLMRNHGVFAVMVSNPREAIKSTSLNKSDLQPTFYYLQLQGISIHGSRLIYPKALSISTRMVMRFINTHIMENSLLDR